MLCLETCGPSSADIGPGLSFIVQTLFDLLSRRGGLQHWKHFGHWALLSTAALVGALVELQDCQHLLWLSCQASSSQWLRVEVGSGGFRDLCIKPVALLGDQEEAVWAVRAVCALYVV
jgi:hypothetical protein